MLTLAKPNDNRSREGSRISLELDFEGDRVTGRLADEQGNYWAFSSWLDLLTLIDRITRASVPSRRQVKGAVSK
jgi:hypothetical protein